MIAGDSDQSLEFQELTPEVMIDRAESFHNQMRSRRSVRDFSDRAVPMRVIDQAILTAGTAPSGANKQPWHFAVTTDPGVKSAIRQAAEQEEKAFYERRASQQWLDALAPLGTNANKPFLQRAPVLIGVFMEKSAVSPEGSEVKIITPWSLWVCLWIIDLRIASLWSCNTNPYPKSDGFLSSIFKRPKNEKPFLLLVVDYPAENCRLPDIFAKGFGEEFAVA